MSEQEKQESQKTIVAFVAGLLIGGLLVWVFGSSPEKEVSIQNDTETVQTAEESATVEEVDTPGTVPTPSTAEEKPELQTGDGAIEISDQAAGSVVKLESAVFPTDEGWVAVRSYPNGQLGSILGAARYSKEQGLIPEQIQLLAPTTAGRQYAVVFFTENGDRQFNLASDVQIGDVFGTFTAK